MKQLLNIFDRTNAISSAERRILISRLLTHSGDQAWDFATPLALVSIAKTDIWAVALYYFFVRFIHALLVTRVCSAMDKLPRLRAVKIGIGAQSFGVLLGLVGIFSLQISRSENYDWSTASIISTFALIVLAGVLASLGSVLMDIGVSNDWIPTIVPPERLAHVNSWLKRIDLGTELGSPIIAGVLLSIRTESIPLLGFGVIALWNILSFIPEYKILKGIHDGEVALSNRLIEITPVANLTLLRRIQAGWQDFLDQPAAMSMLAYALLWLTVLSPHGVLLSAWLKGEWNLSDAAIGIFRGLGAVFGILATMAFPALVVRLGLVAATRLMVMLEAACLLVAGLAYHLGQQFALLFMAAILMSRFGLYGFSLGETEIRQRTISSAVRGRVNGFANALTSIATLIVYGAGSLMNNASQFGVLIYGSIASVTISVFVFALSSNRIRCAVSRNAKLSDIQN